MKCRHFFSFALVAFLSFFFGFFITINNTFAVTPTGVLDSSTAGQVICSSDPAIPSSYDCSDYNYIKFDVVNYPDPYSSSRYFTFQNNFGSFRSFRVDFSYSSSIIDISNYTFVQQSGNNSSMLNGSISWMLLDSLGGSIPSGNIDITSNGIYDVTNYAQATVNVPADVIQGDYHNDLVNINQSIIVCGAILLVLYFFYCIYRLIIKNSGVH